MAPEARVEGGRGGGGGGVPEAARVAHKATAVGLLETVAFQQQQLRQLQLQQQQQLQQLQQENKQQQRQRLQQERRKRLDPRLSSSKTAKQAAAAASDGARMMVVDVGATSCLEGAAEGGTGATRSERSKEDTVEQEVGVSQGDTMDRLAQSLAQVSDVSDIVLFCVRAEGAGVAPVALSAGTVRALLTALRGLLCCLKPFLLF